MINVYNLLLIMLLTVFAIGLAILITGILILVLRASGRDVQTLAAQTTQLAQKGLAEDVAGLVGNATNLLEVTNQLVRTTAGIGVFLTLLGLILMAGSFLLAIRIYTMPL
ncbi:MAG: hypothetical protein P8074_20840 [Anaerolineales bacterium]|jgi:hypothetical protein